MRGPKSVFTDNTVTGYLKASILAVLFTSTPVFCTIMSILNGKQKDVIREY